MREYKINYTLIFTVLIILTFFALLIVLQFWKDSLLAGILISILFVGAEIHGITQLFVPQRIKSVTIASNAMTIDYRKTSVTVPFGDCKKIEHYKHGPLTERINVYAKGYIYEIPFDLRNFHDMCRNIYVEFSKLNMEHITDEWFHKRFSEDAKALGGRRKNSRNAKVERP